mgnify:FL=1
MLLFYLYSITDTFFKTLSKFKKILGKLSYEFLSKMRHRPYKVIAHFLYIVLTDALIYMGQEHLTKSFKLG